MFLQRSISGSRDIRKWRREDTDKRSRCCGFRRRRLIKHWCSATDRRMAIVQIGLRWPVYWRETAPAYLWTFPSVTPTPSSQSRHWHRHHPPIIVYKTEAIRVEVNQFVPLSFTRKKGEERTRATKRRREKKRVRARASVLVCVCICVCRTVPVGKNESDRGIRNRTKIPVFTFFCAVWKNAKSRRFLS